MYQQSAMTFAAFIMLLASATLPAPSSAHPISRREYGTAEVAAPIISDIQGSAPTPTPTPATTTTNIILPRDHESLPSDLASSATDKETESSSEASSSSSPEETQSEESNQDDEHSGLHPNAIAGISVGVFFGVLLLIAAFMWAFRVGWEKGQMQKEEKDKEMAEAKLKEPPAAAQQSWQLVDDCITTRPPSALIINTTGNSCWDGGSWDCCDEHAENHRILGERYSFRPEMGVYDISDLEANTPRESIGTDSGLGTESPRKAKGKEPERPNSPPANA